VLNIKYPLLGYDKESNKWFYRMEEDFCHKKACAFPMIFRLVDLQTELPRAWNSDFVLPSKSGCLFTLPDLPNYVYSGIRFWRKLTLIRRYMVFL